MTYFSSETQTKALAKSNPVAQFVAVLALLCMSLLVTADSRASGNLLCEPSECQEAFKDMKRLAGNAIPTAQYFLSLMYAGGIGTQENAVEAHRWMKRAARAGVPAAQYKLGYMYDHGIGSGADPERANYWFEKSHKNGYYKATERLAAGEPRRAIIKLTEADKATYLDSEIQVIRVTTPDYKIGNLIKYIQVASALDRSASETIGSKIKGRRCGEFSPCTIITRGDVRGKFLFGGRWGKEACDRMCRADKALRGES